MDIQFSLHLSAVHKVTNSNEKRLLLSISAGLVEYAIPGAQLSKNGGQARETLEAAHAALCLARRRPWGTAVVTVHSTGSSRKPAFMRQPLLQARYGAHPGPALRPQEAGGQGEVHPV